MVCYPSRLSYFKDPNNESNANRSRQFASRWMPLHNQVRKKICAQKPRKNTALQPPQKEMLFHSFYIQSSSRDGKVCRRPSVIRLKLFIFYLLYSGSLVKSNLYSGYISTQALGHKFNKTQSLGNSHSFAASVVFVLVLTAYYNYCQFIYTRNLIRMGVGFTLKNYQPLAKFHY